MTRTAVVISCPRAWRCGTRYKWARRRGFRERNGNGNLVNWTLVRRRDDEKKCRSNVSNTHTVQLSTFKMRFTQ